MQRFGFGWKTLIPPFIMCDDAGHKKPTGQVVCTKGPDLSGKYMTYIYSLIIVQCTSMGVLHADVSRQNANDKMPLPKTPIQKMLAPTVKSQTRKSVAYHTLAFCPWHSDQILHAGEWKIVRKCYIIDGITNFQLSFCLYNMRHSQSFDSHKIWG